LGAGGKVLRKIPLIGGLIAALGTASEVSDIEGNDQLSRKEKDQRSGKAVGGFGGMLAGGAAGAKIGALGGAAFGPLGAAIGGALGGVVGMFLGDQAGQIIGDKLGSWVNDLRQYDIPGKLTEAWDGTVKWVKDSWSKGIDAFTAIPDKIASTWDAFVKGVSDKFGIKLPTSEAVTKAVSAKAEQVKEVAGKAVETGKEVAQSAKDKAVEVGTKAAEVGGKAVDATAQAASKAGEAVKQGAEWAGKNTTLGRGAVAAYRGVKAAGEWVLGQTSKRFESGKGGAATVSSGKGDLGGASYGTYQLSSKMGKVQDFLKTSKYGEQFAGLQPGTPEFNAKWKEVAKADPEFATAQHDYIKRTNFDPAVAGLAKAGFNTSNMSQAMQDAIWSTSVQFGAGSEKKGVMLHSNSLH
jgi:hypothetical protein